MTPQLTRLDAALGSPAPWLSPHRETLVRVVATATVSSVASALNQLRDHRCPVRFVAHTELGDEPYEAFIARTGVVPTRDNPHDLLNGLMWLTYPLTKRKLNELQAGAIAQRGVAGSRGSLRDALTIFDENGAVLCAPAALLDALRSRDWHALFVTYRALWGLAQISLFGHALMEKLLQPRKAITAHVWIVESVTDASIAASIDPERLTSNPFLPLPVLGVPGWCAENEDPAFYADPAIFRPQR